MDGHILLPVTKSVTEFRQLPSLHATRCDFQNKAEFFSKSSVSLFGGTFERMPSSGSERFPKLRAA
jgi:hypothetical protein